MSKNGKHNFGIHKVLKRNRNIQKEQKKKAKIAQITSKRWTPIWVLRSSACKQADGELKNQNKLVYRKIYLQFLELRCKVNAFLLLNFCQKNENSELVLILKKMILASKQPMQ